MSGLIHFVSGKTLECNEKEMRDMPVALNSKGVKVKRLSTGALIPMNSTTIEFIEPVPEPEEEEIEVTTAMDEVPPRLDKVEHKPKKTQEEIMAEMMAKASCKHEAAKLELYIQHTAKGPRYFPVCTFCGKRERYVSEKKVNDGDYKGTVNEKWTSEDILNAKAWTED